MFPHRLCSEDKRWSYRDAYLAGPGWYIVKFGGWTVEVCWKVREEAARTA